MAEDTVTTEKVVEKQEAKPKRRRKAIVTRGKKKEAIARATIREGTGRIFLNGLELGAYDSPFIKEVITEPLNFVENKEFDIHINVGGGGFSGQAQAARTAVARAVLKFTKDEKLRLQFLSYDRSFLVEDPRRVEPKKFKGPKARARFTKSYR